MMILFGVVAECQVALMASLSEIVSKSFSKDLALISFESSNYDFDFGILDIVL